jgi:hypothetical protein
MSSADPHFGGVRECGSALGQHLSIARDPAVNRDPMTRPGSGVGLASYPPSVVIPMGARSPANEDR